MTRRAWTAAAVCAMPLFVSCRLLRAGPVDKVAPPQQSPAPGRESAAYATFEAEVARYMALRSEATKDVASLKPTAEAATIARRQDAQAAAIRARRAGAKQGDLFAPAVAPIIGRVVKEELTKDAEERRKVEKENPRVETPGTRVVLKVDAEYPPAASVSTMPAGLLLRLPRLPEGLEYRFVGKHLVVRDVDANIIIDYVLNVVP